jgi:hypothetical protein
MEQSNNKPVLPYAVIAFSNREDHVESEFDETENVTKDLMEKVRDIRNMDQFHKYIEYWDKQHKGIQDEGKHKIDSGEALLKCYYTDVRVIHFPSQVEPTMIHKQTTRLKHEISLACQKSQGAREAVGMKLDAATLPLYVRTALSQFASSLSKPFDFGEAWFELHPVSFDFRGSILTLAKLARDSHKLNGIDLWNEIGDFVASCFFLNCFRANIAGKHTFQPTLSSISYRVRHRS